jgi:hypothetical protein
MFTLMFLHLAASAGSGAIVGAVVGATIVLIIIVAVLVMCCCCGVVAGCRKSKSGDGSHCLTSYS